MVVGFGLFVVAALLIAAGISGRTLAEVVRGELGRGFALADIQIPAIAETASAAAPSGPASLKGNPGTAGLLEVFHDPLGYYFDDGAIHKGAIGNHDNHVHVGGDTALLHSLAAVAHDRFHLHIRQFGPGVGQRFPESETAVTRVHVGDSLHYSGRAFDASGSAADMLAFARWVIGGAG